MNGVLKAVLAAAVCLFLASAAALIVLRPGAKDGGAQIGGAQDEAATGLRSDQQRSADPLTPDPIVEDLSLPPFTLETQDGETVTNAVFDGRLTVVDFVFTNCPLVCPVMTGTLAELSDRLKDPAVRFLSISVDPDRDTPEKLRAFGTTYGADFSRWTFARGDKQQTWDLVRQGLMFAIGDDESLTITLPDGSTMLNIRHPSHFVLVGPKGEVLGLYSATDEAAVKALETRIRQAAAMLEKR